MKSYISMMFTYCFDIIIKSSSIEEALVKINDKIINSNLVPDVQIKYQSRINKFITNEHNMKLEKINNTIHYNRSIIFEDELNRLIKKLLYKDKTYTCEILKLSRPIYCILAYYSGLRKNELRTRLVRDTYRIGTSSYVIDVNKKGFLKHNNSSINNNRKISLKNRNARRRVEFKILNTNHLNLINKYIKLLERQNITFLFPDILESTGKAAKKRILQSAKLDEINKILQETTGRYTVIHSFRHTYITNEIKKLLQKEDKSIKDVFDLMLRIGHNDFETTLINYAHLDLIKIDTYK